MKDELTLKFPLEKSGMPVFEYRNLLGTLNLDVCSFKRHLPRGSLAVRHAVVRLE